MPRIDWAVLCELAFLDRRDRLCMIGVTTQLAVPHLPAVVNQLMIVARLAGLQRVEEIQIAAAVVTPRDKWATPVDDGGLTIEMAREHVLVTLRGIPLKEEGTYTFRLLVSGLPPVDIGVPVTVAGTRTAPARLH